MMSFLFISVIVLLTISTSCNALNYVCNRNSVPCGCGDANVAVNARIVNGENALPNSWPMIVSLRFGENSGIHSCGGTILSEFYILTAAHCVDEDIFPSLFQRLEIAAGIHNLSQPNPIIRKVEKVIIHPLWEKYKNDYQYDIALLHLAEPLDLTKSSGLMRTCIPPYTNSLDEIMQYPSNGTKLVVIGWGQLAAEGSAPDTLQQVALNTISHFDRICSISIRNPSSEFCAGLHEGGKGPCYGDSGGPIFRWIEDRWEQVGIVSHGGGGCAIKGDPGIFTRISYFHDWIESHIRENKSNDQRTLYQCSTYPDGCGCSRRNVALSPSTIVKSEDAVPLSWSMVVSIRVGTNNQHLCTGTILDDSYILTTAHCVANRSPQDLTIEAGVYYQSESGTIIRQVSRIYTHPNYASNSNSFVNDIAILQLASAFSIEEDPFITRTCLFSTTNQWMNVSGYPSNGTRLVISGWDIKHTLKSGMPKILQQAEVYAINGTNSDCSLSNGRDSTEFCAGRYEDDKEICNDGAFGDPIFQWNTERWIQIGIGSSCGMSGQLGIFTSLASYSDWIDSVLNSTIDQVSTTYQCDKKASCGCGQNDVKLTVSGIIGSEPAVKDSWPMIVSFQINNSHICTGTILSDSFILTSGGCISKVYPYTGDMTIVANINTLSETVTIRRKIDKTYNYANYSSSAFDLPDIAIVHLEQPLPVDNRSSILTKTCVSAQNESLSNDYTTSNLPLVIIGWDSVGSESRVSDALQQIPIKMLESEHELCRRLGFNNTYSFCAGVSSKTNTKQRRYLCLGSAGGPVMMYKNNRWEQVGMIPFSYRCDFGGRPDVYTRLSPFIEWMRNVTNFSITTDPPPPNNAISNQRRNVLIAEILFLLAIILY